MKKTMSVRTLLLIGIMAIPAIALAQTGSTQVTTGFTTIGTIVTSFTNNVVKTVGTLFATMAMVAFFFGIVQFIWGSRDGDATKAKNGKNFMLWGLIALFVMFSVWGIITYVQTVFGVTSTTIKIPTIEIQGGGTTGNPTNPSLPTDPKTTYYCDDGVTKYYNIADKDTVCGTKTNNCSTITDAQTCEQFQCTWSNTEGCSP